MDKLAAVLGGTVALFIGLLWQELVRALPGTPRGRVQLIVMVSIVITALVVYYITDSER